MRANFTTLAILTLVAVGVQASDAPPRQRTLQSRGPETIDARLQMAANGALVPLGRERDVFSLSLSSELAINAAALQRLQASGTLILEPTAASGSVRWTLATILDARVEVTAEKSSLSRRQDLEQQLSSGLRRPWRIEFDREGRARSMQFPTETGKSAARLQKWISGAAQFVLPDVLRDDGGNAWELEEQDAVGRSVAKYQRIENGFEKRKLSYVEFWSGGDGLPLAAGATRLERSRTGYSVRGGRIARIESDEVLRFELSAGNGDLVATTRLVLERAEPRPRDQGARGREEADAITWVARDFSGTTGTVTPERDPDTDLARVGSRTLDEILEAIARPSTQPEARQANARSYTALAALLRLDAKALNRVRELVLDDSTLSGTLIDAMGDAGTSDAQKALTSVLSASPTKAAPTRARLIEALGRAQRPTASTVSTLTALLDDETVRANAALALGTLAHRLRSVEPARADGIGKRLIAGLDAASRAEQKITYLRALENAGDPQALPSLTAFIDDDRPALRMAATEALRRVSGEEADELLLRVLSRDADPGVRVRAVKTLGKRTASDALAGAIATSAERDPSTAVRAEALRVLAEWQENNSLARTGLTRAAKSESHERLRAYAVAQSSSLR